MVIMQNINSHLWSICDKNIIVINTQFNMLVKVQVILRFYNTTVQTRYSVVILLYCFHSCCRTEVSSAMI